MNKTLINDKYLLSDILFECKCVLYFIDVSKTASFNYIRNINKKKNTKIYTIKVIVLNKSDLISEVNEDELNQFAIDAKINNIIKVSLLTNTNYVQLLDKIYTIVYESIYDFEVNPIYDIAQENQFYYTQKEKPVPLNILVLGSSEIGKTCLVRRYIKDSFNEHTLESIGMDFASKYIKFGWNI